jgi:hypothetical protein
VSDIHIDLRKDTFTRLHFQMKETLGDDLANTLTLQ